MIATFAMKPKLPSYRLRPGYGQAIVTLTDSVTAKRRDYWPGDYGSPASRGVFTSVASLESAALKYLDARNQDAAPFQWTADANTILGRVTKNRATIAKSGH